MHRRTITELFETALGMLFRFSKKPAQVPLLPAFRGGGALVDIENRDSLYQGHGRAVVLIVDTNVLVYAADRDSPFHDACRACGQKPGIFAGTTMNALKQEVPD